MSGSEQPGMPPLRARARVRSVRRRAGSQQGWARRLASSAQRSCPGLRKTCVANARPPCQAPRSLASCPFSLLQSHAASCLSPGQTRKRAANPTRTRAHFELVRQLLRQRCNGLQVLHIHHRHVHSHAGVVMLDGCGREGGTGSMRKTSMVDCCSQAGFETCTAREGKGPGWMAKLGTAQVSDCPCVPEPAEHRLQQAGGAPCCSAASRASRRAISTSLQPASARRQAHASPMPALAPAHVAHKGL